MCDCGYPCVCLCKLQRVVQQVRQAIDNTGWGAVIDPAPPATFELLIQFVILSINASTTLC